MKYSIFSTAGITQRLSKHGFFNSFDDAWEYIFEHFEEEDFEDLMVDTAERKFWELA